MKDISARPDLPEEDKQPYFSAASKWRWGFRPSAEIWNGRLAMIGFFTATLIEIATGQGWIHFLGFLSGKNISS